MKHKTMKLLPAAVALALMGVGAAQAEGFSYGGYFRAGPGFGSSGHDRTCFQAPGADWKYRLGNECDYYGELGLNYGLGKDDGPNMQVHWMPNFYTGGVSDASSLGGGTTEPVKTEQLYAEAKNMDFAPNTTFWAGTRFYGRADVHIVDTFFVNMSGTGGGADIGLGGPTLGIAAFRNDNQGAITTFTGASSTGNPGTRLNVDVRDLPGFGPNGKIRLTGTYTHGDFPSRGTAPAGTNGSAFSFQSNFDLPGTGSNVLWLQIAQGSAWLNQGFGGLTDDSSHKAWRIVESPQWQVGGFGGQAIVAYEDQKSKDPITGTNVERKYSSIGGRGSWAITNNFKFVAEAGYDNVKFNNGTPTTNMKKLTIAPTVTMGQGYWARPEIRLYATFANWNSGANTVSGPNGYGDLGTPGNNKTSQTTFGIQVEAWW